MKTKLNKKTKVAHKENKGLSYSTLTKKEFAQLKATYKSGSLKFASKDIADAILEDKNIRRGLTK